MSIRYENDEVKNKEKNEGDYFTCSSGDCTGLIPSGIVSDAEMESYKELYPSLTPPVISQTEDDTPKAD